MLIRINTLHEEWKNGEIINEWEEPIDVNLNNIVMIEPFVAATNFHSETAYRITVANAHKIDYLMISQKQYDRIIYCLSQVDLKKLFYDITK
tara:strand:- start:659 stop:934 length:276 start_codon:yes stop_codon:yes gene_type:complete